MGKIILLEFDYDLEFSKQIPSLLLILTQWYCFYLKPGSVSVVAHLSSNSLVQKFKKEFFFICDCIGRNKYCTC